MAAVICSSFGDLCRGCGDVVCLPCKACGVGCSSICEVVSTPFFPYLLTTFGLNIPVLALGLQSIPDFMNGGCGSESRWMIAAAGFAIVHMVASLYIIHRIREEKNEDFVHVNKPTSTTTTTVITPPPAKMTQANVYGGEKSDIPEAAVVATPVTTTTTTNNNNNLESGTVYTKMYESEDDSMSWSRIKHVLCYDKWVAVYIVVAVIWVLWQTVGVSTYFQHDSDACGGVGGRMISSLFCGWFYMFLVGFAFLCGMCCMRL